MLSTLVPTRLVGAFRIRNIIMGMRGAQTALVAPAVVPACGVLDRMRGDV